jgi:hypothetical protein
MAVVGCSSSSTTGTTSCTSSSGCVTQAVGAAGAVVTGPDGSAVDIPAGALTSQVSIQIQELQPGSYPATMPAMAPRWALAGHVFSFEPHGQSFAVPVTITVPYAAAAGSPMTLVRADPSGAWSMVTDAVFSSTTAQVESTHFSFYAVVTGAAAPGADAGRDATAKDARPDVTVADARHDATGADARHDVAPGSCALYDLQIVFSPMYSAVIPGSATHSFEVPAIVTGVGMSDVIWSASSNAVSLSADPLTGGVLITTLDTGGGPDVTISAQLAGTNVCGRSTLSITATTDEAWAAGSTRYNSGPVMPTQGPGAPKGAMPGQACANTDDAGALYRYACIACHAGGGVDSGLGAGFNDFVRTPEQTGGFSDEQLIAMFRNGEVPGWPDDAGPGFTPDASAGYFDPASLPPGAGFDWWHCMHQWGVTDAEAPGLVTYLRALTPLAQSTGSFGGHGTPDGGWKMPDGG